MNKEKKNNGSKVPPIRINKELSKYDNMPIFQRKADEASAFLKKHPPFEAIKAIENERIKTFFVEGKNAVEIAVLMKMSEAEVSVSLKEMELYAVAVL
jgi:hypothetical protein